MFKRSGIRIDASKYEAFKKFAQENAKKHGDEYWAENKRVSKTKVNFDEVDKLCGYKE